MVLLQLDWPWSADREISQHYSASDGLPHELKILILPGKFSVSPLQKILRKLLMQLQWMNHQIIKLQIFFSPSSITGMQCTSANQYGIAYKVNRHYILQITSKTLTQIISSPLARCHRQNKTCHYKTEL